MRESVKTDIYYQICAGNRTFPVRQEELEKILVDPVITGVPFGGPVIYGMLYDGRELVPLLDLSEGVFAAEEGFGKTCVLLHRGDQKLAAAISEIKDLAAEELEEGWEAEEPFEIFSRQLAGDRISEDSR